MSNIEKAILGGLGGLSAVLVKFLGQDYATVVASFANLTVDQRLSYAIGYGILTPILIFLGGFIAWVSDERKRIKIVALAIAAPAMVTTWSGGQKNASAMVGLIVSNAYAGPSEPVRQEFKAVDPDALTEKGALGHLRDGVGTFFGFEKQTTKYWVIVGSYADRNAAQQLADRINRDDASLNAWVGVKVPPNEYYPVIVGGYSTLSEARELQRRALASKAIKDAYLSTGAAR